MDFRYSTIFSFVRDESVEITEASDVVETFTPEEIFHTKRWKPNPRLIRGVSKGIEVELVAAGWPYWLVAAAGNALNGWLPRRADTFEFLDRIGQGAYSNAYIARYTVLNKVVALKKNEVEQLHKVFKLCGSPSDDFWQKSKFPTAQIFKPIEPYRRNFEATFHDVPAAAVRLMDTSLSIEAEYRGTAVLALKSEFFTTEPFACDTLSFPQCSLCRKINAQFYAKKTEIRGRRDRKYVHNRIRKIQVAEANAQLESNMFRRQLLTQSKGKNRLDEKNEYLSGGVLKEGTNSTAFFQLSSRKEGSENYIQREIRKEPIHDDHDIKGKKKCSGPLPAPSGKMQDLIREHAVMILRLLHVQGLRRDQQLKEMTMTLRERRIVL
ncbi:hypothetical protein RDI58_017364 [Solanum bulbocastanum]|uniref:Uncharacterized protein n=1 Tax=Solanum bulbocastanum TaxID=147425 RepID=A0AAN8Y8S9_SOLBU